MTESIHSLRELLVCQDSKFYECLQCETLQVTEFSQATSLNVLRKKAIQTGLIQPSTQSIKLAIIGGCSLRPLADLIEHFASIYSDRAIQPWVGDYDNYVAEALDSDSDLYRFSPDAVIVLPSERRCRYMGDPTAPFESQRAEAEAAAREIIELCETLHDRSRAEIVLSNFKLPPNPDPGPIRGASFASDYSFKKEVNSIIGRTAKPFVHICDAEFLANRMGTSVASDERSWFESKQPGSKEFLVAFAKEAAFIVSSLRRASRKVAVLDLDNTLWGGVVGDDGLDGVEIGTTSARGEAFRHFQEYLLSLSKRGILLAVCSKNDYDVAMKAFLEHPEMVLRCDDIVSYRINWNPKSDNIREIAQELNLGLDSLVFMDDNIAEIEIVRQFVPEVACIWMGEDPSKFASMVQESRLFEVRTLTSNDLERTTQYQSEKARQELQSRATDMPAYLASLEMEAKTQAFSVSDVPRISQLINKSNQFNLTTIRRTESQVKDVISDPLKIGLTVRLSDRFGDHGLIGILICDIKTHVLNVETWIMSCRVLKRQVEDLMLNCVFELAADRGCDAVVGKYVATAKNSMVANHYSDLGFDLVEATGAERSYSLETSKYRMRGTKIEAIRQ